MCLDYVLVAQFDVFKLYVRVMNHQRHSFYPVAYPVAPKISIRPPMPCGDSFIQVGNADDSTGFAYFQKIKMPRIFRRIRIPGPSYDGGLRTRPDHLLPVDMLDY